MGNLTLERRIKRRCDFDSASLAAAVAQLKTEQDIPEVIARVLAARGYQDATETKHYLQPTLKQSLPNPSDCKNLIAAAKLFASHCQAGGKVAICSDFDVDGLSGGSLLRAFCIELGIEATNYVPDRFKDGYGLNKQMVESAARDNQGLLVTIDYGTTNHAELTLAHELGLKTIVIDHHHVNPDQLPPADVFVNPNQPDCKFKEFELAAAGLTWFFLIALRQQMPTAKEIDLRNYLDLAALGTICDMVPLQKANRLIAKKGLEVLAKSKRPGLIALKRVSGVAKNKKIESHHIGFGLGPRINSAGRMLNGQLVIELLTTDSQSKADEIANRLSALNDKRQEVEKGMRSQAEQRVNAIANLPYGIAVIDPNFHTGIIGIVAQRLAEKFYRPATAVGMDGENYKGSVRGVPGLNVIEMLNEISECFEKFGGHSGAAGFTLKSGAETDFAEKFNAVAKLKLADVDLQPYVTADACVGLPELDFNLCEHLETLGPYGVGNSSPVLLIEKLKVKSVQALKAQHLKVSFTDGNSYIDGLMWNVSRHPALFPGSTVDVVCKPGINSYGGSSALQLTLQAAQVSE